jgi:hypothetical protein
MISCSFSPVSSTELSIPRSLQFKDIIRKPLLVQAIHPDYNKEMQGNRALRVAMQTCAPGISGHRSAQTVVVFTSRWFMQGNGRLAVPAAGIDGLLPGPRFPGFALHDFRAIPGIGTGSRAFADYQKNGSAERSL